MIDRSIRQSLSLLLLAGLLGTMTTGCRSFEDAIKPVIDNTPRDSVGQYMTGTRPYNPSDRGSLALNVWRVDSDPFPDSILVYARVMTGDGTFISNLAPPYYQGGGDYREIWNGLSEQIGDDGPSFEIEEYSVREFSDKDGIPFEVALALDYSGSMGSNITFLESAARQFISLKLPQDRIAVVKFDDTPKLVSPLSDDRSDLLARYGTSGLQGYGGYTALYSAGRLGAGEIAQTPKDHPRGLILFTDGEDNASDIPSEDLLDFCRLHKIPVFAVAFGAANAGLLSDIASQTGGRFYQTNDPEEFEAIFKDIYLSLRNYYLITYRPPQLDGKHIVSIGLTPPGSDRVVSTTTIYSTYGTIFEREIRIDKEKTYPADIFFAYNSAELQSGALAVIEEYANAMLVSETMTLEVQGHTDSVGTEAYNDSLSVERANAVRDALVSRGIEASRIRARGFGESVPVETNGTEEGRRANRRTEFIILRY